MKIAIFQIRPGIGDMCLYKPFIEKICQNYNARIYLFTKKRSAAKTLFKYSKYINEIIYLDDLLKVQNLIKFIKLISKINFDKAFIFSYSLKIFFLLKIANVKNVLKYDNIHKNLGIVKEAEIFTKNVTGANKLDISLYLETKDKTYNTDKKRIIIGIGGSGLDKKWPIDFYKNLIVKLSKLGDFTYLIAGGDKEKEDFLFLKEKISHLKLLSLCDFNLESCIEEMKGSYIYVGNDTGFMHISGLLGINTFGIFGDTSIEYATYNKKIVTISPAIFSKGDFSIKNITVEDVFNKIKKKFD